MLRVRILTDSDDLATEFERCCREYSRLVIASAWAGNPGKVLPFEYLRNFKGAASAVIGTSFEHTHPDAIAFLQDIGVDLRIYRDRSDLFHPKVYLFSRREGIALFIGSSNLTHTGFFKNVETNLLLEGAPSASESRQIAEIRRQIRKWSADENSFTPSRIWLAKYRKSYRSRVRWEQKHRGRSSRARDSSERSNWLTHADWQTYYSKLQDSFSQYEDDGRGYFRTLDLARDRIPAPWTPSYFDDPETRHLIIGSSGYGQLGYVAATGRFPQLLMSGTEVQRQTIVSAVNVLARLNPPLKWNLLRGRLDQLVDLEFTMKVWGRLLALVRPDIYCTVSSVPVRRRLSLTFGQPQVFFTRPEGYVWLVKRIHASPWFRSNPPKQRERRSVWDRRVALIDAVLHMM